LSREKVTCIEEDTRGKYMRIQARVGFWDLIKNNPIQNLRWLGAIDQ